MQSTKQQKESNLRKIVKIIGSKKLSRIKEIADNLDLNIQIQTGYNYPSIRMLRKKPMKNSGGQRLTISIIFDYHREPNVFLFFHTSLKYLKAYEKISLLLGVKDNLMELKSDG